MADEQQVPENNSLSQDIRNIVGGVVGLVLIVVPVLLIRKIVRTIEESDKFRSFEDSLR